MPVRARAPRSGPTALRRATTARSPARPACRPPQRHTPRPAGARLVAAWVGPSRRHDLERRDREWRGLEFDGHDLVWPIPHQVGDHFLPLVSHRRVAEHPHRTFPPHVFQGRRPVPLPERRREFHGTNGGNGGPPPRRPPPHHITAHPTIPTRPRPQPPPRALIPSPTI